MRTQIINGRVLTPMGWVDNGSVLIDDTKIVDVLNHSNPLADVDKVIDVKGGYVLPGGPSDAPCGFSLGPDLP